MAARVYIVLLCACLHLPARAATFAGVSAYAAMSPRFPCGAYLRAVSASRAPAMSVLWRTFGEDRECMRRFTALFAARPHLLQIHVSNEACRRGGRCGAGELLRSLSTPDYRRRLARRDRRTIAALRSRVREIRAFAESIANTNTMLMLTTGLEDNFGRSSYLAVLDAVRAEWPYLVARNPVNNNPTHHYGAGADAIELHNHDRANVDAGTRCVANEDGNNQTEAESREFMRRNRRCVAAFLWRAEHQGLTFDSYGRLRRSAPHREREFSFRDVREMRRLLRRAR